MLLLGRSGKRQILRRRPSSKGTAPTRLDPRLFINRPVLKCPWGDLQRHVTFLAWLQGNPVKSRERLGRELHALRFVLWSIEVNLRHLVARNAAGVLDVNGYARAAIGGRRHFQVRHRKAGVGQPESERIQRLQSFDRRTSDTLPARPRRRSSCRRHPWPSVQDDAGEVAG